MIAEFYKKAFTEIWTEPNIIAITPFLLSAGGGGFEGFSFLAPNGDEQDNYKAIANLPKLKGNPILSENPVTLGASIQKPNGGDAEHNTPAKPSFISLENVTTFIKWVSHLTFFGAKN